MKNNLLLIAIAAAAMASCSKTETVDQPTAGAIAFAGAYIGKPVQSKSVTNMDIDKLNNGGFIVYGGYDNSGTYVPVFANTIVSKQDGVWKYDGTKYWVPEKEYKFSAFAPQNVVTPTANNGYLSFDYTSDLNGDNAQKDLIYAAHTQTAKTAGEKNDEIQFQFKHLLSMIKFSFTTDMADGVEVSVSNLSINGVNNTATFTGNGITDAANFGGSWGIATGSQNDVAIPGIANDETITVTTGKETTPFVVIPQTIAADAITVKFSVTATGNGVDIQNQEITATIPAGEWKMGHRYNYSAMISGDKLDLDPIVFGDPTVDAWNDDSWDTATPTVLQ